MTNITAIDVLQAITGIVAIMLSIYVFQDNKRWVKFSQGIIPLGVAVGLLAMAIASYAIQYKSDDLNSILNIIILSRQPKYMVGPSRLVAMSYVVFLYGIEIILIVLFKRYKDKQKSHI